VKALKAQTLLVRRGLPEKTAEAGSAAA